MAEYLSPGVFIEEIPSGLKAIEGVSTSTAAFVGPAGRGTVPGYVWPGSPPLPLPPLGLPFTPAGGFVLAEDPSPVLVTSFSDFQRKFGPPLPIAAPGDPSDYGFVGHAVRVFFDNGGQRAFVARIVGPAATPSTMQVGQGVAYRLLRSAAKTALTVFLTSTRGLQAGDAVSFKHSDGRNALGTPNLGARIAGTVVTQPFALRDGDQLTVTPSPGAPLTATIVAKPIVLTIGPGPTYALADGDTLQLRVGPASEPVQVITFAIADPITPISAGAATPVQVQEVISRNTSGVRCFVSGNQVIIESDVRGTAAALSVVGGTGLVSLGLVAGAGTQAGGSNVADAGHTQISELQTILASPAIALANDGAGHLQIATTATGAGTTIQVADGAGGTTLARLGLGAVSPATGTPGSAGVPASLTIQSYDTQSNSITFAAPIGAPLDATGVYMIGPSAPTPPPSVAAPLNFATFFARSPGSWSAGVTVQIACADRQPVQLTGAAAVGATQVPVQNVSSFYIGGTVEIDHNGAGRSIHQITDINPGTRLLTIAPALGAPALTLATPIATVRTLEIDITVTDTTGATPTENYRGMAWAQGTLPDGKPVDVRRHYAWTINANSNLVWVRPPAASNEDFTLGRQPTTVDGFPAKPLLANIGVDGLPTSDDDWVGVDNGPGLRSGIESLKDVTEARIIAAPGKTTPTVQLALIAQCELLRYRFAILDGVRDPAGGSLTSILTHRNLYDTSFAAYYQPWVSQMLNGQVRYLPPSGFLAGIYARVDNARGVWKAPANENVFDALDLKTNFVTGEQDLLNPVGVNLIRRFDQGGIRVWGARTLSTDPDVKYINVRRTLIFIEASIDAGTQWVVFEPNTPETWKRLTDSVSAFLLTQWRDGALFGTKPENAFFVRCDESTMTSNDILTGRLICQIGVAIVRPAEFVIFQIQQITTFI